MFPPCCPRSVLSCRRDAHCSNYNFDDGYSRNSDTVAVAFQVSTFEVTVVAPGGLNDNVLRFVFWISGEPRENIEAATALTSQRGEIS